MTGPGPALRLLPPAMVLLAVVLIPRVSMATLVGAGDVAFVRFNADGFKDFAIVLLADADAGQLVNFNSSLYSKQYGKFGGDGDHFVWKVDDALSAGTVVTFTDLFRGSTLPSSSEGTILDPVSNIFQLNTAGDTVYAYLGSDPLRPTAFLAGITTESANALADSGLVNGDTAIYLPPKGDSIDEGHYVGSRDTEMSFSDYRPKINYIGNWVTRGNIGTLPAFDPSDFTLAGGQTSPESPWVVFLGLLAMLSCLCGSSCCSRYLASIRS